ncbi:MAG: matrixin family metalloprotease [Acidobacteria bacterium]|nr:matrixin family metalloprotease [Acidobacteriota bacterium]
MKQSTVSALESSPTPLSQKRKSLFRRHLILQFEGRPGAAQLRELDRRGIQAVGYVPENAVVVSAEDGARLDGLNLLRAGTLAPEAKISAQAALLGGEETLSSVVEFHRDTDPAQMRALATEIGLRIREHPDLLRHQLAVVARPEQLFELARWDEVAYIYPASDDIAAGRRVAACAGALTEFGAAGQLVALVGPGWERDSRGGAALQYHFGVLSAKLPAEQTRSELERAVQEWARHARLTCSPGTSATAARTLNFLFADGSHGDPFPFDGPSGTMAHTFYPSPPNPEPLAGDVHFDEDESWRIGADTDLYSVALHELGHALGLGHSDVPGTVMYPFYRRLTELTPEDKQALQTLYSAPEPSEPSVPVPPAEPLGLAITSPESATVTTSAETMTLTGTLRGGTGPLQLAWASDRGPAGAVTAAERWRAAGIPLSPGRNVLTVTATDAAAQQVVRSVTVSREEVPVRSAADTVAPTLTVQSPASANVLVTAASIHLRGTAGDNVGVAEVRWASSSGQAGVARGTVSWSVADLPLLVGTNTVIVRALDTAGNAAWRSLVITRR